MVKAMLSPKAGFPDNAYLNYKALLLQTATTLTFFSLGKECVLGEECEGGRRNP